MKVKFFCSIWTWDKGRNQWSKDAHRMGIYIQSKRELLRHLGSFQSLPLSLDRKVVQLTYNVLLPYSWALYSPNTSNTKSIQHGQIGKVVQSRPFCVEKVQTILRRQVDKHRMIISKIGGKGNVNFCSRELPRSEKWWSH
jgi:hypothetical protein